MLRKKTYRYRTITLHATALTKLNASKRVLLLQGPVGPFFKQLQKKLVSLGKECTKLNLNGGDRFYSNSDLPTINFTQSPDLFEAFLSPFITNNQIDTIVCFGDCRFYHRIAKQVSEALGLSFLVFEEGYIRPVYVTFEQSGVNDYSLLNHVETTALSDQELDVLEKKEKLTTKEVKPLIKNATWYAMAYYFMLLIFQSQFKYYLHHRDKTPFQELMSGILSITRKIFNTHKDRRIFKKVLRLHPNYYLVALQVYNDSQIRYHSDYAAIEEFIEEIITSFAKQAKETDVLVFKHHPLDRGYRHYASTIRTLGRKYAISDRVFYVCDICMPSAIKASKGLITINSTSGLQAMYHNIPVICTGRAIYNRKGLINNSSLNDFWRNPIAPDANSYRTFRYFLLERSLYNGSFYGKSHWFSKIEHSSAD